jgi:hypothetical protein
MKVFGANEMSTIENSNEPAIPKALGTMRIAYEAIENKNMII